MILVQRGPNLIIRDGTFLIRRTRPGLILGDGSPGALGPLAVVDHAEIGSGTVIAMHEHRDDEILSYVGRGALVHEDSAGHRVVLSSARLMMSAGAGLFHEETVPDAAVEMLQIFIRPHASSLPGLVAFHDRTDAPRPATWNLLAGPDDTNAPLTIRNEVSILDCYLQAGDTVELLADEAITRWCYVFAGSLNIGHSTLHKGDSFVPVGTAPLVVRSIEPAIVLIFSIGRDASVVCTGTISGRD